MPRISRNREFVTIRDRVELNNQLEDVAQLYVPEASVTRYEADLSIVESQISDFLQVPPTIPSFTVAGAPAAGTAGRIMYATDGDAGSPCLAVDNGTSWLRVSLGAVISAT